MLSARLSSLRIVVVGAVALAAGLAACTGGHGGLPSSLLSVTTTTPTTYPDYSSNTLPAVAGVTTLAVSLTPGTASISGQVLDDTGSPLPGATVHVERIVGDAEAAGDFPTDAAGQFMLNGIQGGVYRVRAWRAPDLDLVNPQVFYLSAGQAYSLTLQVQRFTGDQVSATVAPNPPIIGEPADLVVEVTQSTVGSDGIVRGTGQSGVAVQVYGGSWSVDGSTNQVTDGDGVVEWQATCDALGNDPPSVLVNTSATFPLTLPPCAPVPTTTTTSTTSTTFLLGVTTTTLRRRDGTSG